MRRLCQLVAALVGLSPWLLWSSAAHADGWSPRPEQYPRTVTVKDLAISMSDGTRLRADLTLPSQDGAEPASGSWPVVVTITAYNKLINISGASPGYLVKRGYAQLVVDARGTGSSEGVWCAFCHRENRDSAEVIEWAATQTWSDGTSAMTGPSYLGIAQIFAAAQKPHGLKAIFPQVPIADVYRDAGVTGGQLDVSFIPAWLGAVSMAGLIPPAVAATDPKSSFSMYGSRLKTFSAFTLPLLLSSAAGSELAYDGPFYQERSPINVVSDVDVPTFLVGGEFDVFQRGTPLLFENLRRRGVPTKLIIGPWDHAQGSSGAGITEAGMGSLSELQLRWFDHYVKGMDDPGLDHDIPPLTFYEQGTGVWRSTDQWVGADRTAETWRLSGTSMSLLKAGGLTQGTATNGTSLVLPMPVAGLCSRSLNQWFAGAPGAIPIPNPCLASNNLNDVTGIVFESKPVSSPVAFQGPLNAHLYVSSTSGDGMLSVSLEDVDPKGKVTRITGGWQTIGLAKLDKSKSRYLDGKLIQPHYPFTKASYSRAKVNQIVPVDVEIFPTAASIQPGHKLRVAIQSFDVPHLLPNLKLAPGTVSVLKVHAGAKYPSSLTLPALK